MEELEDGDQGDANADMKMLGGEREEPVITIGLDGETLADCEAGDTQEEESHIDDVDGDFPDPDLVREARLEELAGYREVQVYCRVPIGECGSHKVIKTKETNDLQKFVAGWWRRR